MAPGTRNSLQSSSLPHKLRAINSADHRDHVALWLRAARHTASLDAASVDSTSTSSSSDSAHVTTSKRRWKKHPASTKPPVRITAIRKRRNSLDEGDFTDSTITVDLSSDATTTLDEVEGGQVVLTLESNCKEEELLCGETEPESRIEPNGDTRSDSGVRSSFGESSSCRSYPNSSSSARDIEESCSVTMTSSASEIPQTTSSSLSTTTTVSKNDKQSNIEESFREERRHLLQTITEWVSLIVCFPALLGWVIVIPLVIFSFSIQSDHMVTFRWALGITLVSTILFTALSCLIGNIYWYYDGKRKKWRTLVHCGKGPSHFTFGTGFLNRKKESTAESNFIHI